MPPMLTTDDASDVSDGGDEMIPPKKTAAARKKPVDEEMEDADDEEVAGPDDDDEAAVGGDDDKGPEDDHAEDGSEEEDEDDEYTVEKIISHEFSDDGTPLYHIKWQGYENPTDRTWEPESNLTGAADLLNAYHKKIGGKPTLKTPASKTKKRAKRKSEAVETTPEVQTSARGRKMAKTNGVSKVSAAAEKKMPEGSWEDIVQSIESIEQEDEQVAKGAKPSRKLSVLFITNDGRKLKHTHLLVRQKCPQKLLDYYEQRLKFVTNEGAGS